MPRPEILIAGRSIANDTHLVEAISQIAEPVTQASPSGVEQTLQRNPTLRLLLLEIDRNDFNVGLLRRLRRAFPHVQVVIIDGSVDRNLLAEAFSLGVKDAFPKPLNLDLLIERVAVLMREA
ncbi:MAG: response regulator [Calditrichaeota bacterium]|nr:MAG: response regulator [Calditrichota bacterium]